MCTRSGVSLVAHRGYIFALGGFDGVTRLQSGKTICVHHTPHMQQALFYFEECEYLKCVSYTVIYWVPQKSLDQDIGK